MAPVLIGLSHGALFALAAPLHDGYLFCPPMPAGIQRKFGVSTNRLCGERHSSRTHQRMQHSHTEDDDEGSARFHSSMCHHGR